MKLFLIHYILTSATLTSANIVVFLDQIIDKIYKQNEHGHHTIKLEPYLVIQLKYYDDENLHLLPSAEIVSGFSHDVNISIPEYRVLRV